MSKQTETLDRLYLEWSQFTKARTATEIDLICALEDMVLYLRSPKRDKWLNDGALERAERLLHKLAETST